MQLDSTTSDAARRDLTDLTPRYAPSHVIIAKVMKLCPVTAYRYYPASARPGGLPKVIKDGYGVLECQTAHGSRYFGVLGGAINSELRMVIIGTNPRDEVRMKWETVPDDRR